MAQSSSKIWSGSGSELLIQNWFYGFYMTTHVQELLHSHTLFALKRFPVSIANLDKSKLSLFYARWGVVYSTTLGHTSPQYRNTQRFDVWFAFGNTHFFFTIS